MGRRRENGSGLTGSHAGRVESREQAGNEEGAGRGESRERASEEDCARPFSGWRAGRSTRASLELAYTMGCACAPLVGVEGAAACASESGGRKKRARRPPRRPAAVARLFRYCPRPCVKRTSRRADAALSDAHRERLLLDRGAREPLGRDDRRDVLGAGERKLDARADLVHGGGRVGLAQHVCDRGREQQAVLVHGAAETRFERGRLFEALGQVLVAHGLGKGSLVELAVLLEKSLPGLLRAGKLLVQRVHELFEARLRLPHRRTHLEKAPQRELQVFLRTPPARERAHVVGTRTERRAWHRLRRPPRPAPQSPRTLLIVSGGPSEAFSTSSASSRMSSSSATCSKYASSCASPCKGKWGGGGL